MQRSNVYAVPKDHILKGFSNSPKTISNSNRRFTAGHRWVLGFLHKRKVRPAASTSSRTQAAISPSGTGSPRRRLRLLRNPGRFTDSKAVQFRWRLRFCGRKSDGRCRTAQCPLFLILHSIASGQQAQQNQCWSKGRMFNARRRLGTTKSRLPARPTFGRGRWLFIFPNFRIF
jgi:hypothetical protein